MDRVPVVYVIGSLRNKAIPEIGEYLRSLGFCAFDDWFAAGPIADDSWQEYEQSRGTLYKKALSNYAARHVFDFDLTHLNRCDIGLLVLPAGKSGHLELGYLCGKGKPCYVLFHEDPERWDVMYQFAREIFFNRDALGRHLVRHHLERPSTDMSQGEQGFLDGLKDPGVSDPEECSRIIDANSFRNRRGYGS